MTRRYTPMMNSLAAGMMLLSLVSVAVAGSGLVPSGDTSLSDDALSAEVRYSYHPLTVNEMADLSGRFGVYDQSRDYNTIVGGHGTGLAPPSNEGWQSMVGSLYVLDSVEADMESIPSSIDLSTEPTFPAVGDQASQPSCAAWAATYYAYGFAEATDLGWTEGSFGSPDQLLSPGWTYNKVNGGRDSGSWMDENMFVVRDWGAATLATMPYDDSEYIDWGPPSAFREAPEHRAEDVFLIPYSGATTIDEIKVLITEGTLVTFAFDALQYSSGFSDGNYILSASEYSSNDLNHAQTIVGFDDSISDDGEAGAFRVVNSWGAEWADNGFYWITYEALLEIGAMGLLALNYITDIPDYSPELVAVWHFNEAPSRSADIEVGLGSSLSPSISKSPFYTEDRSASHRYPTYMSLDITEFSEEYLSSDGMFFLDIAQSSSKGTVSSFKIEAYYGDFTPGAASRTSAQSEDVPKATPGSVTVALPRYDPILPLEALDDSSLVIDTIGKVQWVGVSHASVEGGDSMQSGDVGDGETTTLVATVVGPAQVSFTWKVFSEQGSDVLSFQVPEASISASISGEHDWSEEVHDIGDGAHTLIWSYSKDSSMSGLDDTAWVDSVNVSARLIDFSLESSYDAVGGIPLLVTPLNVQNPEASEVEFKFDWGDDSVVDLGDPDEGHSASHVYGLPGLYTLIVTMQDEHLSSVERDAEVEVRDTNARPVIHSLAISPDCDYQEPGSPVRFDVSVSDLEGDSVTVSVEISALETVYEETHAVDPSIPALFSVEFICPLGSETPYELVIIARDDAEHLPSIYWDRMSVSLLANTPPVAVLEVDVDATVTGESVSFDATASSDGETDSVNLEARWDWESDGEWDTDWSDDLELIHAYALPGPYVVTVEIRDHNDLASTATVDVTVTGEPIPEFPMAVFPVIMIVVVFAMAAYKRRTHA